MSIDIKICGLTHLDDARAALDYGADYLGFVTYTKSKRAVTPEALKKIVSALPSDARCIGVFVNDPRDTVVSVAEECGLYAVQMHGDESSHDFTDMPLPVWRALSAADDLPVPAPEDWSAERFVIDAAAPAEYGGTGRQADWTLAAQLAEEYTLMLAGGLNCTNVAQAIATVRPAGVDVASGIECEPGRKDLDLLKRFIHNARSGQ